MSKTSIFKWVKKNLAGTIVLGAVLAYIAWIYVREINGMSNAATSYDYCCHLSRLFVHNSQTVFFTLYGILQVESLAVLHLGRSYTGAFYSSRRGVRIRLLSHR